MEFNKFLALIIDKRPKTIDTRDVSITHSRFQSIYKGGSSYYEVMNWSTYYKLADLTKYLDYDCRFTELGCKQYCFKNKKEKEEWINKNKGENKRRVYWKLMCCCGGCRGSLGYLPSIAPGAVRIYARHFHYKTGFWREGKGCVLPRKYRSITCLGHSCSANHSETGRLLLKALTMSERQLLEYFCKNFKKHRLIGRYRWSASSITRYFKEELLKEKERRKKCDKA